MNIYVRRGISLIFITIFVLAAPILVLYTAGYRYNIKKNKIQKTGILFLEYKPKEADIFLNGSLREEKSGQRIDNLLPDEYDIEVKKQGYWSWQKKLNIQPNLTTFAQHIILPKQIVPLLLKSFGVQQKNNLISISPDKKRIIYAEQSNGQETLFLYDLNTGETMELLTEKIFQPNTNIITRIDWSAKSNKILVTTQKGEINYYQVIDIRQKPIKRMSLAKITQLYLKNIKWDNANEDMLYGIHKQKLYQINLLISKISPIISVPKLSEYLVDRNLVYAVNSEINKQTYLMINKVPPMAEPKTIKFPYSKNFKIISNRGQYLTLLDEENQILYIIDHNNNGYSLIKEIISGVKYAWWSEEYNRLLWANDLEIWVYDFEKNKKELLTRLSQKIEEVLWYPSYDYVIFIVANTIKMIEKDGRDRRNIYDLVKLDQVSNLMADKEGKEIYFLGKIGNQEGLYELEIH